MVRWVPLGIRRRSVRRKLLLFEGLPTNLVPAHACEQILNAFLDVPWPGSEDRNKGVPCTQRAGHLKGHWTGEVDNLQDADLTTTEVAMQEVHLELAGRGARKAMGIGKSVWRPSATTAPRSAASPQERTPRWTSNTVWIDLMAFDKGRHASAVKVPKALDRKPQCVHTMGHPRPVIATALRQPQQWLCPLKRRTWQAEMLKRDRTETELLRLWKRMRQRHSWL